MSSAPPKRRSSGEHPAVIAYREKLASIAEHTVKEVDELAERIDKLRKRDPRRDGDSDPPVDTIDPDAIPTPTPKAER